MSPAFVVMFAMQHYKLGWEDGLHMVQNRRYCISPNGGFLTQIKVSHWAGWKCDELHPIELFQEYESIYRAQDSVSAYPMTTRQISRRKREEDDQDDEDVQFQYVMLYLPNLLE